MIHKFSDLIGDTKCKTISDYLQCLPSKPPANVRPFLDRSEEEVKESFQNPHDRAANVSNFFETQ